MELPGWLVEVLRRAFTLRRKRLERVLRSFGFTCPPELRGLRVREIGPEHIPVLAEHLKAEMAEKAGQETL
jgi:hypothetical protein